ncbi:hypothetical protein E4U50_004129 [Claviceps purpurea]|nr:hypothetical protein E4U51_003253 [Claviceps purpurea]KAG6217279.1 hypothetical protein E4U50_004129 [Claviceps purpurea]
MRLIGAGMKQAEAHFHCIRIQKVAAHKPLGQLSVVSTGKWKAVRSTLDLLEDGGLELLGTLPCFWFVLLFPRLPLVREYPAIQSDPLVNRPVEQTPFQCVPSPVGRDAVSSTEAPGHCSEQLVKSAETTGRPDGSRLHQICTSPETPCDPATPAPQ